MNLTNKIVWITGASSGIGEALAHEFAKEGAKLVLSARRIEELERVKKSLNLPDNSVLTLPIDMLHAEEFAAKTQTVLDFFGKIDVLVPNAGISQREKFLDVAPPDFKKLMDTNFTSVVLLTREVLPLMVAQKSGGILVTSSVSGKIGTSYRSFYCASKHAVQGFFDSLRGEVWRDGVQVTVACPGYIKTNISIYIATSIYQYQYILSNISISLCENSQININISVNISAPISIFQNQYFNINMSTSINHT